MLNKTMLYKIFIWNVLLHYNVESGMGSVEEVQLGVSSSAGDGKETITVESEDSLLPQVISIINKRQKVSFHMP